MPKGPGTYGSQVGRPKKRKKRKRKMNEQKLEEMIGESIWDTYRDMAYLLSEISAERIEQAVQKQTGRKESRLAARERQKAATDDRYPKHQVSVGTEGGRARFERDEAIHQAKLDLHRTKEHAGRVQRRAKGHPTL